MTADWSHDLQANQANNFVNKVVRYHVIVAEVCLQASAQYGTIYWIRSAAATAVGHLHRTAPGIAKVV